MIAQVERASRLPEHFHDVVTQSYTALVGVTGEDEMADTFQFLLILLRKTVPLPAPSGALVAAAGAGAAHCQLVP